MTRAAPSSKGAHRMTKSEQRSARKTLAVIARSARKWKGGSIGEYTVARLEGAVSALLYEGLIDGETVLQINRVIDRLEQ